MSEVIRASEREVFCVRAVLSAGATITTPLSSLESARAQTQTNYLFPISADPYITRGAGKVLFPLSARLSRERDDARKRSARSAAITTFAAETRVPVWHFQSFSLSGASARRERGAANLSSSPRSSSSTDKRMNLSDAHFWHFINPPHRTWRCVGSWQTKTSPLMNYFSIVSEAALSFNSECGLTLFVTRLDRHPFYILNDLLETYRFTC